MNQSNNISMIIQKRLFNLSINFFLLLSFYVLNISKTYSQENTTTEMIIIKQYAENKKYTQAIELCNQLISKQPDNIDAKVLLAHLFAWNNQYNDALVIISEHLSSTTCNQDLLALYLNVYLWKQDFYALLSATDIAEKKGYINKYDLFLKRLLAYQSIKDKETFIQLVNDNTQFKDSLAAQQIIKQFLINTKTKSIGIGYTIDFFDDFSPQHLETIDFKLKKSKNTFVIRANSAQRFNTNDIQIETDYYRTVFKKDYFYLSYGMGIMKEIFPNHKMAAEYFHVFPTNTEVSLGISNLIYKNDNAIITTGSIAQYVSKYRFGLRAYFLPANNSKSYTLVAFGRKYSKLEQNYWNLEASYGNSPIERINLIQSITNYQLQNSKIKLERNQLIYNSMELKLAFAYHYEEYYTQLFRNRYQIEALIRYNL